MRCGIAPQCAFPSEPAIAVIPHAANADPILVEVRHVLFAAMATGPQRRPRALVSHRQTVAHMQISGTRDNCIASDPFEL